MIYNMEEKESEISNVIFYISLIINKNWTGIY